MSLKSQYENIPEAFPFFWIITVYYPIAWFLINFMSRILIYGVEHCFIMLAAMQDPINMNQMPPRTHKIGIISGLLFNSTLQPNLQQAPGGERRGMTSTSLWIGENLDTGSDTTGLQYASDLSLSDSL